jgi:hypothetical protein
VTMLDRHDAPGRKAAAISNAVDLIDNGNLGIPGQQEISMKRMRWPLRNRLDSTARGNQRLANHLTAEHTLPADLRRAASKQIYLDRLKIKDGEQILYRRAHEGSNKVDMRTQKVLITLETKSKSRYVTIEPGGVSYPAKARHRVTCKTAGSRAGELSKLLDRRVVLDFSNH